MDRYFLDYTDSQRLNIDNFVIELSKYRLQLADSDSLFLAPSFFEEQSPNKPL